MANGKAAKLLQKGIKTAKAARKSSDPPAKEKLRAEARQ
jgi:hypothetical protein